MTPVELMTLYMPFLICWFLIWLTNMAEYVPQAVKHKPEPRLEEAKDKDYSSPQTMLDLSSIHWNVSSFLGFGLTSGTA